MATEMLALVVSALALALGLGNLISTHRQADAAERAADEAERATEVAHEALRVANQAHELERERLDAELTPKLSATVTGPAAEWQTVRLQNEKAIRYDTITLRLEPSNDEPAKGFRWGIDPPEVVAQFSPVSGVGPYGEVQFDLVRGDPRNSASIRLLITAVRAERSWDVVVPVSLPGPSREQARQVRLVVRRKGSGGVLGEAMDYPASVTVENPTNEPLRDAEVVVDLNTEDRSRQVEVDPSRFSRELGPVPAVASDGTPGSRSTTVNFRVPSEVPGGMINCEIAAVVTFEDKDGVRWTLDESGFLFEA